MKKPLVFFALTLVVALTGASLAAAQTTYELPTGTTLTVINQLPETLRPYFDETQLVNSYGRLEPATHYRVGVAIEGRELQLMFMIPEFDPEDFAQIFYPRTQYPQMLSMRLPHLYLHHLRSWYSTSFAALPHEMKQSLRSYSVSYFAIFQKGEHWLMFPTTVTSRGLVQVSQPITSNDPRYGSVSIWPATHSGSFTQIMQQGLYPLDAPIDRATGEKNTSWLIFDFFDMAPEQ